MRPTGRWIGCLSARVKIENGLARQHLKDGMPVLYDVSSSYFEGRHIVPTLV